MKKQKVMRQVSRAEVEKLLNQMKYQRDQELSISSDADVYVLEDGHVLLVCDDPDEEDDAALIGALWESKAALLSVRNEMKYGGPNHILNGRLPQGRNFATAVPRLIDELALRLQLPRSFFDYSEQSICELDKLIRERFDHEERIEP